MAWHDDPRNLTGSPGPRPGGPRLHASLWTWLATSQRQADAAARGEAVRRAEREVAAGARAVVVDLAVVARGGAVLDRAAVQRRAAIAVAADLEVGAAVDDQRRVGPDHRIAARDLDGVIGRAAA